MGYKNVCLKCRRVENLGTDFKNFHTGNCPLCSSEMYFVNHAFRPPKKHSDKEWKVVEYLIKHGFIFHHIYQEGKSEYYKTQSNNYISYPKTIEEAKEFVVKYKNQAVKY